MSSRYIIFSDLHLHPWSYGSSIVRGRNSRLLFQQAAVLEMFSYAQKNHIEEIIFCGDFFHSHSTISAEVIQATWEIFRAGESPVRYLDLIFLMGNHDMGDKSRNITSLRTLNPYGRVITDVAAYPGTYDVGSFFIPYCESKDELESFLKLAPSYEHITIMHQGVAGIPVNSTGFTVNEILTEDMLPTKNIVAFSGHYHSHKKINDRFWIPGSVNQLTWSDVTEKRGWLDVEIDNDLDVKVTHIESTSPKFIYKRDTNCLGDIKGNLVRIDCSSHSRAMEIKEEALKFHPLSLEVRVPSTEPEKIEIPRNFSTILDLFHEYIETNNFSPDFVKIGKDIINKSI